MKKYFSNKGSTLVLLVVAIAIISLLGTSILGVTMMNLKIKKTNTEIKQSFYLSESGLDESYAKAYDHVQEAVKQANDDAKIFIDEFKSENMDFLIHNSPYSLCLDTTTEIGYDGLPITVYTFNEEKIKMEAEKKFNEKYKQYLDGKVVSLNSTNPHDNPYINVTDKGWKYDNIKKIDYRDLGINSKYTNDNNIQKTTAVNLIIEVPKYDEPYTVSTKAIPVNPFWTKAITAKNLFINSGTEITGNVYLSENLNVDALGINSIFNGKLAVKEDINLNGVGSNVNVKNVYANNILLNGNRAELLANCSGSLNLGSGIYVKDDLEINKSNQKVIINGSYYGFSDGSSYSTPDNSSGININTTDTDSINIEIKDDVYLHGTSYVNAFKEVNGIKNKYQTGESVSIKGNYRAYIEPLFDSTISSEYNKDLTEGNINFEDYEYLRFADSFKDNNEKLTAFDKAYYMYYYNNEYVGLGLKLPHNIKLATNGNINSIGNTISNGYLYTPNFILEDNNIYKEAEDVFNLETQRLGDGSVEKSANLKFVEEVNLNNLTANINKQTASEIVYINKDGGTFTLSDGNFTGLIVTNGDVKITGSVTFKGSIICGGDITIEGSESKRFTYDRSIVSRIIAEYNLHKTVFKSDTSNEQPINITTFVTSDGTSEDAVNIDFGKLLKYSNWEIK